MVKRIENVGLLFGGVANHGEKIRAVENIKRVCMKSCFYFLSFFTYTFTRSKHWLKTNHDDMYFYNNTQRKRACEYMCKCIAYRIKI